MLIPIRWLQHLILAALYFLIFWSVSWDHSLGMDSMTYASLAKRILMTGDWLTLHYSSQAYSDFYQHPPLLMWIQAGVFRIFGMGEFATLITSGAFALGTLLGVYLWGKKAHSRWMGFLAGIVLLTSTRYVKFANQFMLDGPLCFWLVWAGFGYLGLLSSSPCSNGNHELNLESVKNKERPLLWALLLGLTLSGGFFTKGIAALILPAAVVLYLAASLILADRREFLFLLRWTGLSFFIPSLLIGVWVLWGNGAIYLTEYLHQSVAGRTSFQSVSDLLKPTQSLVRVYWPWLAFWVLGALTWTRTGFLNSKLNSMERWRQLKSPTGFAIVLSSLIVIGLSTNGYFLEHHMTPFYPFAAICVAAFLHSPLQRYQTRILQVLGGICLVLLVIFACFPMQTRGRGNRHPLTLILREAVANCQTDQVSRLLVSSQASEIWPALATGMWITPWDTVSVPPQTASDKPGQIFLIRNGQALAPGWELTAIQNREFTLAQTRGSGLCDRNPVTQ